MYKLPKFLSKYFWGDDLSEISLNKHKNYIAKTILSIGDLKAVEWLNTKFNKKFLVKLLNSRQIDQKSKNFWNLYYS